jgi:dihydroxyacid dehydratase/phosphogluconate dehydratase
MALGGSTNALIHVIALARRAGIELDLDRFEEIGKRSPYLVNMRPAGKYLMEDFYYAGGLRRSAGRHARSARRRRDDLHRPDARREHRRAPASTTTT